MERYLAAARTVSELAVASQTPATGSRVIVVPADRTQEEHVDGLPFGTRGGMTVTHTFPFDGEYEIQVRLQRNRNENVEGLREPHEVEITLDGERLELFTMVPDRSNLVFQANAAYYSDEGIDNHLNVRLGVTAGPHAVGATFIKKNSALLETSRQPYQAHFNNDRHPRQQPAVRTMSIVGPFDPTGVGETPSRDRIFTCRPANGSAARAEECATSIIGTLARRAYRRPVTVDDLDQLLSFYREGYADGGFDVGIETALRALLASPEFLFRVERDPAGVAAGTAYRVSDLELATRLSFFLWSSLPDDELVETAAADRLRHPAVLEAQVRRMLADPRAETLTTNFASQWLHLRNLDAVRPDSRRFPDFDDNLRQGFRRETQLLFQSIVDEDRSVTDPPHRRLHVRQRASREALRDSRYLRRPFPPRHLARGEPARRSARPREHLDGDLLRDPDIAGAARKVDSREPARRAAAGPTAQCAAARRAPVDDRGGHDARADGGPPGQSGVRGVSQEHGPGRTVDGELRRHRPVAGS